jgi:hypothetical protein
MTAEERDILKMYFKPLPTQLELMEKLYYCQTTKQCYVKGQTQNPTPTLYAFIFIDGQQYAMNRIVWTYHFGLIPDGHVIDHADRNKLNNDINNLELGYVTIYVKEGTLYSYNEYPDSLSLTDCYSGLNA